MNEQELAELQKACDSATPGPWTAHDYRSDPSQEDWFGVIKGAFDIDGKAHSIGQFKFSSLPSGENWANANFIALARNALPTLLAMVRELKRERDAIVRAVLIVGRHNILPVAINKMPRDEYMQFREVLDQSILSAPAAKGCKEGGSET